MINNNEILDDKFFNELFGKVKHNTGNKKTRKNKKL